MRSPHPAQGKKSINQANLTYNEHKSSNQVLVQLLAEFVPKSQTIREVFIESSALKNLPEKLLHHFGQSKVMLIADENTWSAGGLAAQSELQKAGYEVEKHLFPANPQPRPTVETSVKGSSKETWNQERSSRSKVTSILPWN